MTKQICTLSEEKISQFSWSQISVVILFCKCVPYFGSCCDVTLGAKLNFRYHQREEKKIEEQAQNNNFIELFDDKIETGHNFLLIVLIYTMQYVWHYPFHSALLLEKSSKIFFPFMKLLTVLTQKIM